MLPLLSTILLSRCAGQFAPRPSLAHSSWPPTRHTAGTVLACQALSPYVLHTSHFLGSTCSLGGDTVSPAWWPVDSCAVQELLSLALVELNVEQNQTGPLKGLCDPRRRGLLSESVWSSSIQTTVEMQVLPRLPFYTSSHLEKSERPCEISFQQYVSFGLAQPQCYHFNTVSKLVHVLFVLFLPCALPPPIPSHGSPFMAHLSLQECLAHSQILKTRNCLIEWSQIYLNSLS